MEGPYPQNLPPNMDPNMDPNVNPNTIIEKRTKVHSLQKEQTPELSIFMVS